VEQFFENGGREALIVRVANGARPPSISLPAGGSDLKLVAVNPGSREYLRTSVDYDGLNSLERDRFNLVVQRVRTGGSELVEDQEIYRRVSVVPASGRFVPDVLLGSRLVRVAGAVPAQRPDRSAGGPGGVAVGYTLSPIPMGMTGAPLTDYDIIGAAGTGTGLFALQGVARFNLLCVPPLTRERDVGTVDSAGSGALCRDRQALLLVDPPASWTSAPAALDALRVWPFRSDSAVMYYPRVQAFDRLRGRIETFGSCGAAAGMIARSDEARPVWAGRAERGGGSASRVASGGGGVRCRSGAAGAGGREYPAVGAQRFAPQRQPAHARRGRRLCATGSTSRHGDWRCSWRRASSRARAGCCWNITDRRPGSAPRPRSRAFSTPWRPRARLPAPTPTRVTSSSAMSVSTGRRLSPEGKFNLLFGFASSTPGVFDTWLVTQSRRRQPGAAGVSEPAPRPRNTGSSGRSRPLFFDRPKAPAALSAGQPTSGARTPAKGAAFAGEKIA